MANPVFDDAVAIGKAIAEALTTGSGTATLDAIDVKVGDKTVALTPSLAVTVK